MSYASISTRRSPPSTILSLKVRSGRAYALVTGATGEGPRAHPKRNVKRRPAPRGVGSSADPARGHQDLAARAAAPHLRPDLQTFRCHPPGRRGAYGAPPPNPAAFRLPRPAPEILLCVLFFWLCVCVCDFGFFAWLVFVCFAAICGLRDLSSPARN